ncbi:MAG: hypothetical protein E6R04_00545 [Spirochaetes bacterium]|jgi:hypothetical protein|nr:MAG: hypothetical protein E6R04_00545 [Spirochaetota bacterium]
MFFFKKKETPVVEEPKEKRSSTGEFKICMEQLDQEIEKNKEVHETYSSTSKKLKDSVPPTKLKK